ncbi:hypothetical protein RSOL_265760, partial [Rhizoctonia solani AG-3 Rhs1AP]
METICHNCGISGHTRIVCRKPGGGAYRGRNSRSNQDQNWRNDNQNHQDDDNNFVDTYRPSNNNNRDQQQANYVVQNQFAYSFSFRPIAHPISRKFDLITPDSPIHSHSVDILPEIFPDLSSIDSFPPIFDFEEPEVPVQSFAPSEGEIDIVSHILNQAPTAELSTRHEDSQFTIDSTQGEHPTIADADIVVAPVLVAAPVAIESAIALTVDTVLAIQSTVEPAPITTTIAVQSTVELTSIAVEPIASNRTYSVIDLLSYIATYTLFWSICYCFCDAISTILLLIRAYNILSPHICALMHSACVMFNTTRIWLTCNGRSSICNIVVSIADPVLRHQLPSIACDSLQKVRTRIACLISHHLLALTSTFVDRNPLSLANWISLYFFSYPLIRGIASSIADHIPFHRLYSSTYNSLKKAHTRVAWLSQRHLSGLISSLADNPVSLVNSIDSYAFTQHASH